MKYLNKYVIFHYSAETRLVYGYMLMVYETFDVEEDKEGRPMPKVQNIAYTSRKTKK